MKTKQTFLKAFASVALAMGAFASADAQTNLGAACGCPATGSRPTINLSSVAEYTAVPGTGGGKLSTKTLTCDKTWVLDVKIYVDNGQILTIEPGTLIKGAEMTNPSLATALVISRGGKIMAAGTASCPIVFTAQADPMNGTYAVSNVGKWGGVVLLGKARNNLTLAANGPFVPGGAGKLAIADGVGTVEGFASTYVLDQYGVATATPPGIATGTSPASTNPQTPTVSPAYTYAMGINGTQGSGNGGIGNSKIKMSSSSLAAFCFQGHSITGTGIPANTTVVSVSSDVVTISNALTAVAAGTYTLTGAYPLPASTTQSFYFVQTLPSFTDGTTGAFGPEIPFGTAPNDGTLINQAGAAVTSGPIRINYAAPYGSVGTTGSPDDNDNSGIMQYVSIRHSGAILSVGAEINGLTLASVGRGTTIDHIEIVSCADDNIEIFGGTVNLKYITTLFGNDDMFDYDLGWTGKTQFFFGMKNTMGVGTAQAQSPDNDNGIEADSDDNSSNSTLRSHPILYNFTILGNGKITPTADNRSLSGVNFKEQTEGELYNSIFVNFKNGINIVKTLPSGRTLASGGEAWHNWTNNPSTPTLATATTGNGTQSLKIKCNTLWMTGLTSEAALGIDASSSSATATGQTAADITQFTTDLNNTVTGANGIPGMNYNFTIGTNNAITAAQRNDVTPTAPLSVQGCPSYPTDNFFEPVSYRGAFSSVNKDNWLSTWSYSHVLNSTVGVRPCPTDLNADGLTDILDFLIFAPAFGSTCQ